MRPDIKANPLSGGWLMYSLNGVAAAMPAPDPAWGPQALAGYERRVEANLTGQCACGATADVTGVAPRQARGRMVHEDDCPANDDELKRLVDAGL